jgi:methionine synthase II (cobalamin-independent)
MNKECTVPSFPTTVVGSLPRPLYLEGAFDAIHEGRVSGAGTRSAVPPPSRSRRRRASTISDGEWRRFSYVAVITDVATGFKRELSGDKRDGTCGTP